MGEPMTGGFPGEPWTDGTGAVADQACQVMGAPALGRIHHQRTVQPQFLTKQVVMNGTNGQQRRHRHRGGRQLSRRAGRTDPIGQHQHLSSTTYRLLRRLTQGP